MTANHPPTPVADALARAAEDMDVAHDLDDTLETIVVVARRSLDGVDHAGISLLEGKGQVTTRASTDTLVNQLDALQYALGSGPCLDTLQTGEPPIRIVNHLGHEQRWPEYVARAAKLGLKAQMGLRLSTDKQVLGVLNLYSTSTETFEPEVQHMAELFATHAAVALGHARLESNLNAALAGRTVIATAVGIIMERYTLTETRAFEYLARVSQNSNLKLRDIATEVVDSVRAPTGEGHTDGNDVSS